MWIRRALLIVLPIWVITCQADHPLDEIGVDEAGNLVDGQGRVMMFHGFNSVMKSPPYYLAQADNETQLQMFKDMGMNVIRLGVIWSGVMPEEGKVNHSYLEQLERIVDNCAKYGIYVFLDMHQDGLSTRFGSYDAVPLWLVDSFPKVPYLLRYPFPLWKKPKEFFMTYVTYATENCAQNIYKNVSGAWIHWGNFWKTVAEKFSQKPSVLGYELINEPPPGNFYKNPALLLPGYVGTHNLLPVYDYLVRQIRQKDKKKLIFYEPVTYGVFFPPVWKSMSTGFDRVPGSLKDPSENIKSVLSYHYYCWVLQTADPSKNMPYWKRLLCDKLLLPAVFDNSLRSIRRTGGARFLTEFGLCAPDGNEKSINTIECNAVLEEADAQFQSWTFWDGNFLDSHGNPIPNQVKFFSRTYPRATAGEPIKYKFDYKTGNFHYTFDAKPTDSNSTVLAELFVPMNVHYPDGVIVNTMPDSITHGRKDNIIEIYPSMDGLITKTRVTVTISRR